MRIAILMTNTDDSAFAERHPKDGEKFIALLSPLRPDWRFTVFNVTAGEMPSVADFDAGLITGSPASVHDGEPWVAALFEFIRVAHAKGVPIYGACFGHQAIAMALGGHVARNPAGWVFGRIGTELTQPWDGRVLALNLYSAHREQVTVLPEGATVTGTTEGCPIASFAIGRTVWTTQYHPEMTPEFIAALVEEYGPKLPPDVAKRARTSLSETADRDAISRSIVEFFEAAR